MPRQEKISRMVRIAKRPETGNCNSAPTVEAGEGIPMSPDLPKNDSQHSSEGSQTKEETDVKPNCSAVKRPAGAEDSLDFSSEMQKILENFGSDINKTLSAKKLRLEKLTTTSLKSTNKRIDDSWKIQQIERQKLYEDFQKQTASVLQQWEMDLEKAKENEEKLSNLLRQQQKLFQQTRIVSSQRLRTIKELQEQYMKGVEDLEKNHLEQQTGIQGELKKEMGMLQKKILMDTQQQEMATVRKSLQTMLF